MLANARALHFVLKIGNLKKNLEFFRDKLGMKVLRHEVFDKGCEAACNGPYAGKWSKTMIGYGPEDDHFVLELTYNYSVASYKLGNDLKHIVLGIRGELFDKIKSDVSMRSDELTDEQKLSLNSPDGYKFILSKLDAGSGKDPAKQDVLEVCLTCKNLVNSLQYWTGLLKMRPPKNVESSGPGKEAIVRYAENQAALRLFQIDEEIDHKSAFGRIAFSCPSDDLKPVQASIEEAKHKVLTPYLSLDTPGKATVQVVILADPDGHEICFVGDEGFRSLSQIDPDADSSIEKSIAEDKSDEWFRKHNTPKTEI